MPPRQLVASGLERDPDTLTRLDWYRHPTYLRALQASTSSRTNHAKRCIVTNMVLRIRSWFAAHIYIVAHIALADESAGIYTLNHLRVA